MSHLYSNFKSVEKELINYAWICFSIALILNLISQISGYFANKFDIMCTNNLIDETERDEKNINVEINDTIKKILNYVTYTLNIGSLICLITGIIQLTMFVNNKI